MGNFCCAQENQQIDKLPATKRKASLKDPSARKQYESDLTLEKYSQQKSIDKVTIISQLGKGGQASVFLVQLEQSDKDGNVFKKIYAMKRVSKSKLDIRRTKKALLLQKQIMANHKSNFLTEISFAFQDKSYLYYLMGLAEGGDLFSFIRFESHINKQKVLQFQSKGESVVSFILAGAVIGLEYLHNQNIIYRDLKPQNILIYSDGYPKLADFGIAKRNKNNELCYDIKGTLIYFPPQMVAKKGYDKSIDLWALGVLLFQLLFNTSPFTQGQINSHKFQQRCLRWEQNPTFPKQASQDAKDLIKKFLRVCPEERLGYQNFGQVKSHPFFREIEWEKLESKQLISPLKQIIERYPIEFEKSMCLNETVDIDERQNIPFTYVKNTAVSNSCVSSDDQKMDQFSQ